MHAFYAFTNENGNPTIKMNNRQESVLSIEVQIDCQYFLIISLSFGVSVFLKECTTSFIIV